MIPFRKMNGLGNDFVVLDAREAPIPLGDAQAKAIADRDTGIGCDQLIILEPSKAADLFMRIRNADGGEVDACGNATRCIADLVMDQTGTDRVSVETNAGILDCTRAGERLVTVDIGPPKLEWHEIPIAERMDTRVIELQIGPIDDPILHSPSVVNVGNPHCFFWVDDVEAYDLSKIGPLLEHHPVFPERANISLAHVTSPTSVTLKVWERGVGLTRACGTAACAVAGAAARRKFTGRKVTVTLPGGDLDIEWRESDGHVLMTGPVAYEFEGVLDDGLLAAEPVS
jgi:diaminopimelate epimerase